MCKNNEFLLEIGIEAEDCPYCHHTNVNFEFAGDSWYQIRPMSGSRIFFTDKARDRIMKIDTPTSFPQSQREFDFYQFIVDEEDKQWFAATSHFFPANKTKLSDWYEDIDVVTYGATIQEYVHEASVPFSYGHFVQQLCDKYKISDAHHSQLIITGKKSFKICDYSCHSYAEYDDTDWDFWLEKLEGDVSERRHSSEDY